MNKKDFDIRTKIIRETFNDERPIKCQTPEDVRRLDDGIHPGGDIFTTEDGEFIDFEFQDSPDNIMSKFMDCNHSKQDNKRQQNTADTFPYTCLQQQI